MIKHSPQAAYEREVDALHVLLANSEEQSRRIRERLRSLPMQIVESVDMFHHEELGKYLYWHAPEVTAESIARDLFAGNISDMLGMIAPFGEDFGFVCVKCGGRLLVWNRTELYAIRDALANPGKRGSTYKRTCEACRKEFRRALDKEVGFPFRDTEPS